MIFPSDDESIGEYAAFVRLFRLARLLKILAKYAELRMILVGLAAGMKSSMFILLLLGLAFYLFATAGLLFFAHGDGQEFGTYPLAFQTLFRAATFEDWTDVMYINYYGCGE
jgi:voltage-gated sodium channel